MIGRSVRRFWAEISSKRFWFFFGGSLTGLIVDFSVLSLLLSIGWKPGYANLLSSSLAITCVYFLVTRFAFKANRSMSTYVIFIVWYASAIIFFSWVIQTVTTLTGWNPLLVKAGTLPFSFGLNFLFGRVMFTPGALRRVIDSVTNR